MIREHCPLNENLAIPLRILIKIYFLFIVSRALINNNVSSWYLLLLSVKISISISIVSIIIVKLLTIVNFLSLSLSLSPSL